MDKELRCTRIRPGQEPETIIIPNTLEALQAEVGGYIEVLAIAPDITMVFNEEGKLEGLPYNFSLPGGDFIVGTCLFILVDGGEEFLSMSEERAKKNLGDAKCLMSKARNPFLRFGRDIPQ